MVKPRIRIVAPDRLEVECMSAVVVVSTWRQALALACKAAGMLASLERIVEAYDAAQTERIYRAVYGPTPTIH